MSEEDSGAYADRRHLGIVPGCPGDRVEGACGSLVLRQRVRGGHHDVNGHEGGAPKALANLDVDDAARRATLTRTGLVRTHREAGVERRGRQVNEALRAPGAPR